MNLSQAALLHPCVAHRGWSGGAPENTLASFRLAMTEPAVQWIELDVHLSRDGIPVVIHDGTLGRTTNGKGKVGDHTAAELAALDAGSWFHKSYAGEPVPTLEQVLGLACGRCRLNIELKDGGRNAELLVGRAVGLIRAYRMENDIVFTSFDDSLLQIAKRIAPEFTVGWITDKRPTAKLVPLLRSLQASVLSIDYRFVNEALLVETSAADIAVMAWTVNEFAALKRLAAGRMPFQLCTNYPDRWLAAVQEGSLP